MLKHTAHKAWHNKPKLSLVFWLAFAIVYFIGFLAVASLSNAAVYDFLGATDAPRSLTVKLGYIRLPVVVFVLAALPVLLWQSLERALLLLKFASAIAIVVYVDDHLVLYEFVGYPRLTLSK